MEILIYIGAFVTVIGLVGLVTCIARANRLKKSEAPEDELTAAFQKLVALNLGSLFLSAIGLMCVIVGLFLS